MSADGSDSLDSQLDAEATSDPAQPAEKKPVKPETLAFQTSFAQSAAAAAAASASKVDFDAGGQRSQAWFDLRQGRLTASAFANAIG